MNNKETVTANKKAEKILGQIFEIMDGWKEILDFDGKSKEFEKVYWYLNCLCEFITNKKIKV